MQNNITVEIYNRNLSSPTLIEDITHKIQRLKFSTKLHGGFHICSFDLMADLPEAWEWITKRLYYRLLIRDGVKTLWEGRLEDVYLTEGGAGATAYGYYVNLSDIPYATAYNANADVVIKAVLTANCSQISSDQTHIDATGGPAITSAADAAYLDIYPKEIVEKLANFSDDTNSARWYFGIWEDRIAYFFARSVSSLNWAVSINDFAKFRLKYRGAELWNSCYAVYDAAGLARTATANDTDSQEKYGDGTNSLIRRYVIPQLGTVVAGAATSARDGWLEEHKEVYPKLTDMMLGDRVFDTNGRVYPSSWVRAGEVIRVEDLVPASVDATTVTRDRLRTYYIVQTEYNLDNQTMRIVPDTESTNLNSLLSQLL